MVDIPAFRYAKPQLDFLNLTRFETTGAYLNFLWLAVDQDPCVLKVWFPNVFCMSVRMADSVSD